MRLIFECIMFPLENFRAEEGQNSFMAASFKNSESPLMAELEATKWALKVAIQKMWNF